MIAAGVFLVGFFLLPATLRGLGFHNLLVRRAADVFRKRGIAVSMEHGLRLPDGRTDYVDLLAWRDDVMVVCEVETSARNVVINALKAEQLNLPLWILTPTRAVRRAAKRKLAAVACRPGGHPICFLLIGELGQAVSVSFGFIPAANPSDRKQKRNPNRRQTAPSAR